MKQTVKLLKGSAVQIYRDQMLFFLCLSPFLISILIRIAVPIINDLLLKHLNFSIEPYYLIADAAVITLGPMMISIMTGLLMLDERDDGICQYYSVTPAGGKAYLLIRFSLPFFYSLLSALILIPFTSMGGLPYVWMIAPAVSSSYNGILMGMLLVSIASNKVEGLAVSKLLGIMIFGIPMAWFADSFLKIAGFLLPTYWVMDMLIQAKSEALMKYVLDLLFSLVCTTAWITILYRQFIKKVSGV